MPGEAGGFELGVDVRAAQSTDGECRTRSKLTHDQRTDLFVGGQLECPVGEALSRRTIDAVGTKNTEHGTITLDIAHGDTDLCAANARVSGAQLVGANVDLHRFAYGEAEIAHLHQQPLTRRRIDGQETTDFNAHVEPADEHDITPVHRPSADDRAEALEYSCANLFLAASVESHDEGISTNRGAIMVTFSS